MKTIVALIVALILLFIILGAWHIGQAWKNTNDFLCIVDRRLLRLEGEEPGRPAPITREDLGTDQKKHFENGEKTWTVFVRPCRRIDYKCRTCPGGWISH